MILPGKVTVALTTVCGPDTPQSQHVSIYVEVDLRGLEWIGMLSEHKTVEVAFEAPHFDEKLKVNQDAVAAALAPYEVDGWQGRSEDLFNGHRRVPGKPPRYRVSFHRFVPRPEPAP